MKKEARLLREKAIASLLLCIDHFNRVSDTGRVEAVLIFLDHAFEMLLKASILQRGGKIRERRQKNTIGFDACVMKALSDAKIQFLTDDQVLVLQTINGLRDAAQHHLLNLSEGHLYLQAQNGITLFRDVLSNVFNQELADFLPDRVLSVSTVAPVDPILLFAMEMEEVAKLLAPKKRKRTEAEARLRGLVIVDGSLRGEKLQPGAADLRRIGKQVADGKALEDVFPGIASVEFTTEGVGPKLSLRIAKKDGIPIFLVPEGTPGSSVVAVKRVNELGFYSLGHKQLAARVGLTTSKTTAAVWYLSLQDDPECFKEVRIGKSIFKRYSQNAIERVQDSVKSTGVDEIWRAYSSRGGK